MLEDVLYIPSNPQHLISLGRWDKAGGSYHGGQGVLQMITKKGVTIAKGTRITNHLYKLQNLPKSKPHLFLGYDDGSLSTILPKHAKYTPRGIMNSSLIFLSGKLPRTPCLLLLFLLYRARGSVLVTRSEQEVKP